jgi:hypothetical protein
MVAQSKKEYLARIKDRYRKADRRGKSRILDEFCEVCGHHRKHAIRLLGTDARRRKKKPGRPRKHGKAEIQILENIWEHALRPCSVRLASMLELWLPSYEQEYGYLDEMTRAKLLDIKPRTLDRLLLPARRRSGSRGLSGTRHGDYLKSSIPIKTNHADVAEPGFFQADTVAHCGNSLEGNFVWSLTFTDVFTGWTENGAVWNKGQYDIHRLLEDMELRLPFGVKAFHSDNGGEFVNRHLYSFYRNREKPVLVTRARPGKSNDNPHVEQKNYTHVRRLLGYQRFEDQSLVALINQLYEATNLMNNFFCSSRRLVFKERRGSRYYKRYDQPATPCQRLLESGTLNEAQITHLKQLRASLNPYNLSKMIEAKRREIASRLR